MPLFVHSGAGSTDLGSAAIGTARRDISDLLLASLVTENNFIGSLQVGEEFGDTTLNWIEDSLNAQTLQDGNTSFGSSTTTFNFLNQPNAAVAEVGAIMVDENIGNFVTGEQIQVQAITGTTAVVLRGYAGTTAVSHANNSVWRVIERPTYENSDLGRDLSKARIIKTNTIQRFERNVNISQEQLLRAKYNYASAVPNELRYQFEQRLRELLREMNNAAMYSNQVPVTMTATGSSPPSLPFTTGPFLPTNTTIGGDYSTLGGLVYWLGGLAGSGGALNYPGNQTAAPLNVSGATLSDAIINQVNRTLLNNGATPDWIFGGTLMAHTLSQLYNDRIRIVQDDTTRGFKVKEFDATLQNTLRILWDRQFYDNTGGGPPPGATTGAPATSGNGIVFIVDSGRIRIRPFVESLFYTIQSPSFRDGDAVRMLSKWSMEVRNSGNDAGAAHTMVYGLNFSS